MGILGIALLWACGTATGEPPLDVPATFVAVAENGLQKGSAAWFRGALVWVEATPSGHLCIRRIDRPDLVTRTRTSLSRFYQLSEIAIVNDRLFFAVASSTAAELFMFDGEVVSSVWQGESSDFLQVLPGVAVLYISDDYGLRRVWPEPEPRRPLGRHTQACVSGQSVLTNEKQAVSVVPASGRESMVLWTKHGSAVLALNCSSTAIAAIERMGPGPTFQLLYAASYHDQDPQWRSASLPQADAWRITRAGDRLVAWAPALDQALVADGGTARLVAWGATRSVLRIVPSDDSTTIVGITEGGFLKVQLPIRTAPSG